MKNRRSANRATRPRPDRSRPHQPFPIKRMIRILLRAVLMAREAASRMPKRCASQAPATPETFRRTCSHQRRIISNTDVSITRVSHMDFATGSMSPRSADRFRKPWRATGLRTDGSPSGAVRSSAGNSMRSRENTMARHSIRPRPAIGIWR